MHHLFGFAGAKVAIFSRTTKHLSDFLQKSLLGERFWAINAPKKRPILNLKDVAALTAFLTAISTTSCMGQGPF